MTRTEEVVIRMTREEYEKRKTASGIEFDFLRLNGKVNSKTKMGIKVSRDDALNRDIVYAAQVRGYKNNVGPPVGKKVTLIIKEEYYGRENVYYGYETGICDRKVRTVTPQLQRKLKRMKLDGDLHNGNIGTWKNKRVLLDFGTHSNRW